MAEFDTSDGEDGLVALRAIGEDEPLGDPNADTFDTYFAAEHQVCLTDFLALLCCTTNLSNG